MTENVIIIGGGPAGLAASIYTARAGLNPLVIAGSPPGGQLILTTEVENYPGFESVLGPDLIDKMRRHALKFNVRIVDQNVVKVDFSKRPFKVFMPGPVSGFPPVSARPAVKPPSLRAAGEPSTLDTRQNFVTSSTVIIATGAKALWLNLPSEQRLRGKGVSACATCDGFFFKDKTVAVIGGGDTAMEEALTLTRFAKTVYIIHRRGEFRASKIMQDRVLKHPKIKVIWNSGVEEVVGEKKVEGINIKILDPRPQILEKNKEIKHLSSDIYHLNLDGVFIAIGHKPDTDVFKDNIELDKKGYIITTDRIAYERFLSKDSAKINNLELKIAKFRSNYLSMTSVPGVFAGGDCVDFAYRQAATAVGMGVAAALEVEKWLEVKN